MAQALRKSQVVTHAPKKARILKKARNPAADLSESKMVVKFKPSRNSTARSKKRLTAATTDEVFATLAKVFSKM